MVQYLGIDLLMVVDLHPQCGDLLIGSSNLQLHVLHLIPLFNNVSIALDELCTEALDLSTGLGRLVQQLRDTGRLLLYLCPEMVGWDMSGTWPCT